MLTSGNLVYWHVHIIKKSCNNTSNWFSWLVTSWNLTANPVIMTWVSIACHRKCVSIKLQNGKWFSWNRFSGFTCIMMYILDIHTLAHLLIECNKIKKSLKGACSDPQPLPPNLFQIYGDFGTKVESYKRSLYVWNFMRKVGVV